MWNPNTVVDGSSDGRDGGTCIRIGKSSFLRNCGACLLVLAPVFSNYQLWSAVSIGDAFGLLGFALAFRGRSAIQSFPNQIRLLLNISLFILFLFAVGSWGLAQVDPGIYRLFIFSIMVSLVPCLQLDIGRFWSFACKLGVFFSFSIIIQFALFQAGIVIPFKLPIPTYELDTLEVVEHVYRSGGWFREPSYYMLYMIPVLLHQARSGQWGGVLLNSTAAVVSTSSLAFLAFFAVVVDRSLFSRVALSRKIFTIGVAASISLLLASKTDALFVSRFLDIAEGGGSYVDRVGVLFEYVYQFLPVVANPALAEPILALSRSGGIWLSSISYVSLMLGYLYAVAFIAGLTYLRVLAFSIFVVLFVSTHVMSTAACVFLVLGLHWYGKGFETNRR